MSKETWYELIARTTHATDSKQFQKQHKLQAKLYDATHEGLREHNRLKDLEAISSEDFKHGYGELFAEKRGQGWSYFLKP